MMNTWIEPLVGYVPWLNERETPVYRQNRKRADVHKALHLNDDAEKLYVESIEYCVETVKVEQHK